MWEKGLSIIELEEGHLPLTRSLSAGDAIHFCFGRLIPNNLSLPLRSPALSLSLSSTGLRAGLEGSYTRVRRITQPAPPSQGSTLGKQVAEIIVVLHGWGLLSAAPLASRRRRAVGGRGGSPVFPGLAPQPRPRLPPPTGGSPRRTSCHGRTRHHRQHTSSPPPRTHCVTPAVRASAPSPCPTASASASHGPTAAGAARGVCGSVGSVS